MEAKQVKNSTANPNDKWILGCFSGFIRTPTVVAVVVIVAVAVAVGIIDLPSISRAGAREVSLDNLVALSNANNNRNNANMRNLRVAATVRPRSVFHR